MKKMGRPTSNPRTNKLSFRLTDEKMDFVLEYSKQNNITITETISRGLELLMGKKK